MSNKVPNTTKALKDHVVNSMCGRSLLVEFTCGRCGMTQLIPFIENPAAGAYANLTSHDVPEGWLPAGTYTPLLCPNCVRAFERFMEGLV